MLCFYCVRESLKCKLEGKRKLIQRSFRAESLKPTLNPRAFFLSKIKYLIFKCLPPKQQQQQPLHHKL